MAKRNKERIYPEVVVRHASPNYYSGRGSSIGLSIVHATAGHNIRHSINDLAGLGNFFGTRKSDVSSHVASDNDGHSARFVSDLNTAWHVANYNRVALGIEQILPGTGAEITEALYKETARWLAYWRKRHGVPLVQGHVRGLVVVKRGVMFHSQLGTLGGGHSDPGPHYSMKHLLRDAHHFYKRMR